MSTNISYKKSRTPVSTPSQPVCIFNGMSSARMTRVAASSSPLTDVWFVSDLMGEVSVKKKILRKEDPCPLSGDSFPPWVKASPSTPAASRRKLFHYFHSAALNSFSSQQLSSSFPLPHSLPPRRRSFGVSPAPSVERPAGPKTCLCVHWVHLFDEDIRKVFLEDRSTLFRPASHHR